METKKDIRARIRKKRMALLPEERQACGKKIEEQLIKHPFFQNEEDIYCYASFSDEVPTFDLIKTIWKMGKKVAVPKVYVDNSMKFYYIESLEELKAGYHGIPEPENRNGKELQEADGTRGLVLLPGTVFDRSGNRIGYGKGFYDVYLKEHPHLHRIGLAFSIQCVEQIPAEAHDIRVEAVITEKGNYMTC